MASLTERWLRPRSARTQFPPYDFGDPSIVGQAEARTSTLARIYHKGQEQSWDGRTVSMRWVLVHMIEETARHAGHMDIVRELIDGATGAYPKA